MQKQNRVFSNNLQEVRCENLVQSILFHIEMFLCICRAQMTDIVIDNLTAIRRLKSLYLMRSRDFSTSTTLTVYLKGT